ncbi:MAG: mutY [Gammaproteobacteria bacterium]|jgi:A/G-specific adenine glycosylase|nr:mutY [Gammaproteobacteria bacterium]
MSKTFSAKLLKWFDKHGRKDLPWQHPRSAYFVWLSEIMLQQTQVVTVIPYFQRFIERFPDVNSLAQASEDEVLRYWAGLGYYSRARNLHKAAQKIMLEFQGEFPRDLAGWQSLPGVGRSTAGAIIAQAFGEFGVILDGNVKRVLRRFYATHEADEQLWPLATKLTPQKSIIDYSQAIMDLGAMVCTRSKPKCMLCPLNQECSAYQTETVQNYPAKKQRKALPEKEKYFLLMINEKNEILLERQPSPGIWGGLWSLPSVDDLQQFPQQALEKLPSFTHTFTHFKLTLKPVKIRVSTSLQISETLPQAWILLKDLSKYALPTPIKVFLCANDL